MKILFEERCVVGEGPIWNGKEKKLYYTDAYGKKICFYEVKTEAVSVRFLPFDVAAFAFDGQNNLIVSHEKGVHILRENNSLTPIYDESRYQIRFANDMKVGPDGAIYVGTQCGKRKGVSDKIDGKLYRISKSGEAAVLLDGLILSNGMDWSMDEKRFYHTDTPTNRIKEYAFDKNTGAISFTGRQVFVEGVDGFTMGANDCLYVACWGYGHIAVIDTKTMEIAKLLSLPCKIPSSCAFCGENMDILAVTTANKGLEITANEKAGCTLLLPSDTYGREPFVFDEKSAGRLK